MKLTSEGGQGRRADHGPYIAVVGRELGGRDIRAADVTVTASGDGRCEAALLLRPDDSAFAERVAGEAQPNWDE